MGCEAELEAYRRSLHKLREAGLDPYYPGASIRREAIKDTLTRAQLDAYLEHLRARAELLRCARAPE